MQILWQMQHHATALLAEHARMILPSAEGGSVPAIAQIIRCYWRTVRKCFHAFAEQGLAGLVGKKEEIMFRKILIWIGIVILVLLIVTAGVKLVSAIDRSTRTLVVTNDGSKQIIIPTIDGSTPTSPQTTRVSAPSGEAMPVGDLPSWKLIFSDDFNTDVPLGAFSDCNHNTDTPQAYCEGLKPYGAYYSNWWAYPNTWDDTAKSGADGNTGAPFGGVYHPEDTVSVSNGAMHIKMYRPSTGGDNHVATVVPIKCMDQQYGRYVERFKAVKADPGFKSAHLFYTGGYEIDYPENDYGYTISAYTHPGGAAFRTAARWTQWHTTAIEWTASSVRFYLDGKLIGTTSNQVPHIPMSWILQNESSILGPYAEPGASAQLDLDWVACYSPAS